MSGSEKLTTYVCIADTTIKMYGSFTVILRYSVSETVFVKLHCFFFWHRMNSRDIFTWFDLSILKQSKLLYAMP